MLNHTTTLSQADLALIKQWSRIYRFNAWFCAIFFLPLAAVTTWILMIAIREQINLDIMLIILSLFDLFLLWMIGSMVIKVRKIQSRADRNEKQVITGTLASLQVKKKNRLVYDIDGRSFTVIVPDTQSELVSADHRSNHTVKLEIFEAQSDKLLLLAVNYESLPSSGTQYQPIYEEERKANKKGEPWTSIFVSGGILTVMSILILLIFGTEYFPVFCLVLLISFLLVASVIYFSQRRINSYSEKLVITGTIAESIRVRFKSGRYNSYQYMNWYRIGHTLIPGSSLDKDDLQPGDAVCFEYYADKQRRRRELIRFTIIVDPGAASQ